MGINFQELTFLVDESIPRPIVIALRALKIPRIEHFLDVNLGGVDDVEWLQSLSGHNLVVLSNNDRILWIPDEKRALMASDLGFIATQGGKKKIWQQARDILRFWDRVSAVVGEPRPFAYKLTSSDFRRHELTANPNEKSP